MWPITPERLPARRLAVNSLARSAQGTRALRLKISGLVESYHPLSSLSVDEEEEEAERTSSPGRQQVKSEPIALLARAISGAKALSNAVTLP